MSDSNPSKDFLRSAVQSPSEQYSTDVHRDFTKSAALDVISPVMPLQQQIDDRTEAMANSREWVARIMRTFNARMSPLAMPKDWAIELQPEWDQWETNHADRIRNMLSHDQQADLLQARATILFHDVVQTHGVTADGRADVRRSGVRFPPDLSLNCVGRLQEIVQAMETLAHVRHDVILGKAMPELIADPCRYAATKISQRWDIEVAKEKHSHLRKKRPPPRVRGRKANAGQTEDPLPSISLFSLGTSTPGRRPATLRQKATTLVSGIAQGQHERSSSASETTLPASDDQGDSDDSEVGADLRAFEQMCNRGGSFQDDEARN
ncbi:hypothetical protein B0A48_04979 [Cryoendolithus antarcticus]|uniref:Uncharacterized protein n=1 Tax=Cryoendolithus antarcticus TaxID=1507870 RepID=A0A1V8TDV3_9PEZI|nr:hypothetical protein B0A48_04979 [Cryoendolithus antarcticus]